MKQLFRSCGSESCVALLYFIAPAVQPAITIFAQQKWQVKCGLDSVHFYAVIYCQSGFCATGSYVDDYN